jgi:uncharacterized protein (TIGR02285 family)
MDLNSLILFTLIFSFEANAAESIKKRAITWFEVDYPPAYFLRGEMKGKGFCQIGLNNFIEGMPSYTHKKITVNINRMLKMIKDKNKIYCAPQLGVHINQFPGTIYSNIALVVPPGFSSPIVTRVSAI